MQTENPNISAFSFYLSEISPKLGSIYSSVHPDDPCLWTISPGTPSKQTRDIEAMLV